MSLTVFMIHPIELLVLVGCWLAGAALIVALFLFNRRRLLAAEVSERGADHS